MRCQEVVQVTRASKRLDLVADHPQRADFKRFQFVTERFREITDGRHGLGKSVYVA
ncbi:hypothetical protein ACFQ71_39655 [Streptomyces sp. NPDC056534]|uniref:hypothetical protein n=1 Tax=Streptomyces sp. NPDC056534 TaxID=3345857 RepID=UPI0036B45FF7